MKILKILLFTLVIANSVAIAQGGKRFTSSYPCSDAVKTCVSKGARIVDGFEVHRDCWEWSYVKTCNYPSKNDCRLYTHCYAVGNVGCLLQDSQGQCVNMQKEFSCKSWEVVNKVNQTAKMSLQEKAGKEGLVCTGVPCIDGHCVDKSYMTDGDMMDSISKLYATSHMNPDKNGNFNLFMGSNQYCAKKPVGYSNCCRIDNNGWGKQFNANCTKDEQTLMDMRSKNLCVYVGKDAKKKMGVETITKHHFCCWGNLLDKVIQVEGRKQLGINFGSGGSPHCRGLTLEEIQRLDFSKMDFSEFIEEFKVKFAGKYKTPKAGDMAKTVEGGMDRLRKYDNNPDNQKNNMTGWSGDLKDDSWEADEERRIESERLAKLEKERLAKLETEKIEREKLAQQNAKREAQLAQEAQIKSQQQQQAQRRAQQEAQMRAQQQDPKKVERENMLKLYQTLSYANAGTPEVRKNTEILNRWVQANKHRPEFVHEIGGSAISSYIELIAAEIVRLDKQAAALKK